MPVLSSGLTAGGLRGQPSRASRVGRPIRVKLHAKKREHDPDLGDSSLTRGAYVRSPAQCAVYCVQSVRATSNGRHGAARAAALHATNRGPNAGGDIASNTSSKADLTQLRASETLGSLPGLPQTRTLRPRRYRAVLRGWAFRPLPRGRVRERPPAEGPGSPRSSALRLCRPASAGPKASVHYRDTDIRHLGRIVNTIKLPGDRFRG